MASLRDVALRAGVATGTVSRYLNTPERVHASKHARIKKAIEELNYSPNLLGRNLRRGRTGLVVAIVPAAGDPFYGDIIRGISTVGHKMGLSIHIREARRSEDATESDVGDLVLSQQADGILLLGGPSSFDLSADFLAGANRPPVVVVAGRASGPASGFFRVQIDNIKAAEEVTSYLIGLGHRRIGFIRGEPWHDPNTDRLVGYRNALKHAGLEIEEAWLVDGKLSLHGARLAARELLFARPGPTAIVCVNDETALGAIAEIRAAGLSVPGDISVVGFDDMRYSEVFQPALTTVSQPAEMLGERGMYRLAAAMRDRSIEGGVDTLSHRLIIRESTGPVSLKSIA